jgi:peptide/nickel transport system permease protein
MISGYFGRTWIDIVIMRFADMLMTCPSILLGLTILYILSPGIWSLVTVLALTRLPVYMRLARAQVLDLRERAFVDVSRGLGSKNRRIIFSDLRPLVVPTIGTVAMLELCTTLLNGAGLSFLGVGLQPPTVDWGLMVGEGQDYLQTAWWLSVFPGVAIMLVTFSANLVSNWLRSMADPTEMSRIMASRKWARPSRVERLTGRRMNAEAA